MSKKTIIFFDEIQEPPSLLKFLRYFYEERPEIAVIAAGSLLEIALKKEDFSFPVGRAEQFVAQHLAYLHNEKRGPELFYWLRDKGSQKSEIDFLIQRKDQIIPIEVKSSAAGHLKSLFYFAKEKRKKKAIKISLDNYSIQSVRHIINEEEIEFELEGLPQFAIETI